MRRSVKNKIIRKIFKRHSKRVRKANKRGRHIRM